MLCSAQAQKLTEFSQGGEKFIEELTELFKKERRDEGKDFIEKKFAPIWIDEPAYLPHQQELVYITLNQLLKNNNKVYERFTKNTKNKLYYFVFIYGT